MFFRAKARTSIFVPSIAGLFLIDAVGVGVLHAVSGPYNQLVARCESLALCLLPSNSDCCSCNSTHEKILQACAGKEAIRNCH